MISARFLCCFGRFFYAHLPPRRAPVLPIAHRIGAKKDHQLLFKIKLTCLICPHPLRRDAPKTFTRKIQRKNQEKKENRKALLIALMPMDSMYLHLADTFERAFNAQTLWFYFLFFFRGLSLSPAAAATLSPFTRSDCDSILIAQLA